MENRYYSGCTLSKDLKMCEIMKSLEANSDVLILSRPERVLVHEMEYADQTVPQRSFMPDRADTGRTHEGFASHFVVFAYMGYVFTVVASDYYPFVDVNHPGRFNFIAHRRVGLTGMIQCSFYEAFEGIASIDAWFDVTMTRRSPSIKDAPQRRIDMRISGRTEDYIAGIVKKHGARREKAVMRSNPFMLASETWNEAHKIVDVISSIPEDDGFRPSFEVDIETGEICG